MSDENAVPADQLPSPTPNSELPSTGRLLGLDFGTKRIGVAVSDVDQRFAAPSGTILRSSAVADATALRRFVTENAAVGLVVGLPVHMSGDEGGKAKQAREFGIWAGRATGLPVVWWDERHTSTIAEGRLISAGLSEKKRKGRIDSLAAQIMLTAFLESSDRQRWATARAE